MISRSDPIRAKLDAYFSHRNYQTPDPVQSLLFLVSEVGELVGAYMGVVGVDTLDHDTYKIFDDTVCIGNKADALVSRQRNWERNNGRVKPPCIEDEAADVLMMLERFLTAMALPDAETCLDDKIEAKGMTLTK